MHDAVWGAWNNNYCGSVYQTVKPIWDVLTVTVSDAGKQTGMHFNSVNTAYVNQRKLIQDKLDRLSSHSSAGRKIVAMINLAAMLFMTTVAVECAYHFRSLYWMIMKFFIYFLYLVLVLIVRGISMFVVNIGAVGTACFLCGVIITLMLL